MWLHADATRGAFRKARRLEVLKEKPATQQTGASTQVEQPTLRTDTQESQMRRTVENSKLPLITVQSIFKGGLIVRRRTQRQLQLLSGGGGGGSNSSSVLLPSSLCPCSSLMQQRFFCIHYSLTLRMKHPSPTRYLQWHWVCPPWRRRLPIGTAVFLFRRQLDLASSIRNACGQLESVLPVPSLAQFYNF